MIDAEQTKGGNMGSASWGDKFGEVKINKNAAKKDVGKYRAGCVRFALGRIMTMEEFEKAKKRIQAFWYRH